VDGAVQVIGARARVENGQGGVAMIEWQRPSAKSRNRTNVYRRLARSRVGWWLHLGFCTGRTGPAQLGADQISLSRQGARRRDTDRARKTPTS